MHLPSHPDETVCAMNPQKTCRMRFGLRLKELRAERHISQDAFAHSIGMARSYYAEVEIGKRNIALENICKIARGFGISVAELFDSELFEGALCDSTPNANEPGVVEVEVDL